jgi:predicted RNA binding protein YcfA (HicA-like mRNA interferase family)
VWVVRSFRGICVGLDLRGVLLVRAAGKHLQRRHDDLCPPVALGTLEVPVHPKELKQTG